MKIVAAYDSSVEAVNCYNANLKPVAHVADLTAWRDLGLPECDGIIGGPPCQPFSHAGKGLGAQDERDMLPSFLEIVTEIKPAWFLMENVPGLDNSRHRSYLTTRLSVLGKVPYLIHRVRLDAADFGVPQRRIRLFIVGVRADAHVSPSELVPTRTHGRQPSFWDAKRRWVTVADVIPNPPAPYLTTKQNRTTVALNQPSPALQTDDRLMWVTTTSNRWQDKLAHRVRLATIDEKCLLMSFPLNYAGLTSTLVGNAVAPAIARAWGRQISQYFPNSKILSLFSGAGGLDFITQTEPPTDVGSVMS